MQPEKPTSAFETTMRHAFTAALSQPSADSKLRRLVINKLRAGVGVRRSTGWRVTRK